MKLLTTISILFIFSTATYAGTLSSCQNSCFENKQKCNTNQSHTFNTCDHDLFTCQASCNSGKMQETYSTTLPIDISFHPTVKLEK
jgi:hypothetical protein